VSDWGKQRLALARNFPQMFLVFDSRTARSNITAPRDLVAWLLVSADQAGLFVLEGCSTSLALSLAISSDQVGGHRLFVPRGECSRGKCLPSLL